MYRRCVNEYLTRVVSSRYVSLSSTTTTSSSRSSRLTFCFVQFPKSQVFGRLAFHAHILWRQGDNLAFLTKIKREESPPLSSDKDAFGRGTDESGTESETGRSLAIVETMNVRPEMGRARAEFFKMLFHESRAPSFFGAHTMNIKRTLLFIVWWHCRGSGLASCAF